MQGVTSLDLGLGMGEQLMESRAGKAERRPRRGGAGGGVVQRGERPESDNERDPADKEFYFLCIFLPL